MNKETLFLPLCLMSVGSSCFALALDTGYGFAYGCIAATVVCAISLCGGDDQRTLPTQCLDEACKMMENVPGIWYLVATPGHCVVAHKSKQLALGVFGYAVVDNRPDHKRTVSASIAKGSDK